MEKIILITGTSTGFGKKAVSLLLQNGHTVIAGIRGGQPRLERIFSEELANYPGKLLAVDIHMERPETFEVAKRLISDRFGGRLNVLINNAGYGLMGALEDQTPAQLRLEMEVNYFGPMLLTRSLLPELRASHGRIINLSSIAGLAAFPCYGAYNAAKHALDAHTEALYYELKPFGVQVALIEPGGFKTDFTTRSLQFGDLAGTAASPYSPRTKTFQKFLAEKSGMGGDPLRVAKLMVRLCERERISLRNVIGADALALFFLKKILPENWRVAIIQFVFRKFVFKD